MLIPTATRAATRPTLPTLLMSLACLACLAPLTGCIPVSPDRPGGSFSLAGAGSGDLPAAAAAADGDKRYTILLTSFTQPNHAALAKLYRERLSSELRWRDLFVVSSAGRSELYWGAYRNEQQAQENLQRARQHKTQNGLSPFIAAAITALPGADPATGKWDIHNCPGAYSLLVAVFENQPEAAPPYLGRRDKAETYCRLLREEGLEAWYHHGEKVSSVTVGSFPRSAIEISRQTVPNPAGKPIIVEKKTPVGPELLALMQRFEHLAYNGREFYEVERDAMGNVIHRPEQPAATYPVAVPDR